MVRLLRSVGNGFLSVTAIQVARLCQLQSKHINAVDNLIIIVFLTNYVRGQAIISALFLLGGFSSEKSIYIKMAGKTLLQHAAEYKTIIAQLFLTISAVQFVKR
jgi:hypothetical protein